MAHGEYETRMLGLAAYLVLAEFDLVDVRTDRDGRARFFFANTPDLQKELLRFANRSALVEPNAFLEQTHNLKAVLAL